MNLLEGGDPTPDIRAELEQKWKDKPADEVLKAKVEADLHIKTLEKNNAELREMFIEAKNELTAKAKFEEYIDQMKRTQPDLPVANTPANEVNSPKNDPMEFKKIASDTYQEFERLKQETENFKKVENKLKDKYGNNYASILKDQASYLGLADEEINGLAKKSPEAFFRLMGINDTSEPFQSPPRSGQRNDSFAPKGAPRRDWNYYQAIKKSNPVLYLDPKTQTQMDKDAQALGEGFYS